MNNLYKKNVFLNCPFDKEYSQILNSLIFTVLDCGFSPKCALEFTDSSEIRLDKICKLIEECKYGIHDLSRTSLDKKHKLPRFNMPFELGLFIAAKKYGQSNQRTKDCIILERKKYQFQKFISDVAGNDIEAHKNNYKNMIRIVRDWLSSKNTKKTIPSSGIIIKKYDYFNDAMPSYCKKLKLNQKELTYGDYLYVASKWLGEKNPDFTG